MSRRASATAGSGRRRSERGQAQIELVAAVPIVLLVAAILAQVFAIGYAQSLADGAAEAGAIAISRGEDAEDSARAALPGWARGRVEVEQRSGRVAVGLAPPTLLPPLAKRLSVDSSAYSRPPEDG